MDKIRINPVKATCMKYDDKDYGIQAINDTCFGICAAFSGTNDVYQIDPECAKACEDLVEQRKIQIFSVGSCDHQVPYRPVIWQQTGRYVPQLIRRGLSPDQARDQCIQMCEQHDKIQDYECIANCILDYNAIEGYSEPKNPKPQIIVAPDSNKKHKNVALSSSSSPDKKQSYLYLWIILAVIVVTIVSLLIIKRN